MKINDCPPITDKEMEELDRWYEKFSSNSFEMKFCDADYWKMRERLKQEQKKSLALLDQLRVAEEALNAIRKSETHAFCLKTSHETLKRIAALRAGQKEGKV